MKWSQLLSKKGVYISDVFDISSNFETYIHNIVFNYAKNDGLVDVFIRISYDSVNWGDWIKINETSIGELFKDDFYNLEYAKFQYKVELTKIGQVSPEFSRFSFELFGSYVFTNTGDEICRPELWITKRNGSGDVKLTNETNGQTLIFTDLNNNEQVYVDCENEDIETDLPLTYRYKNHNNVFIEFEVGDNILTGEGDFELTVRYEFKTLQG